MTVQISILGPGCDACDQLLSNASTALADSAIPGEIQRVTDVLDITAFKVAITPALVINGNVLCSGRVPNVVEIKRWLDSSGE